jgi:hypothetical protein
MGWSLYLPMEAYQDESGYIFLDNYIRRKLSSKLKDHDLLNL